MKQNLYLFLNSILHRRQNTLYLEIFGNKKAAFDADIDDKEQDTILLGIKEDLKPESKKFIPAENVESIFTFGEVRLTSHFLNCVSSYKIPVHIFNYYGKYNGSFLPKEGINSGNTLIDQVINFNDACKRIAIAKSFVRGAAENAAVNLKYYSYRGTDLNAEMGKISEFTSKIESCKSIGELMGTEGIIKNIYYGCWKKIFKQEIDFNKRVRNPPDNLINSLLSFGNTIMYSVCLNEIYRTGLNPSIGYLHSPGDNRLPLCFDLAEIFKPLVIDKVIFRVINLEMIKQNDVRRKDNLFYLNEKPKRKFVEEIEGRLKTTIYHNELKRNVSYRTLIRLECHKLIDFIRNGKEYRPFKGDA